MWLKTLPMSTVPSISTASTEHKERGPFVRWAAHPQLFTLCRELVTAWLCITVGMLIHPPVPGFCTCIEFPSLSDGLGPIHPTAASSHFGSEACPADGGCLIHLLGCSILI